MTGAAFIGGEIFIQSGCKTDSKQETRSFFSSEQSALLDEIGETILPETDTPGAKSVNIGAFMQKMVNECYSLQNQTIFVNGVEEIRSDFEKKYSISFVKGTKTQREEYLNSVNISMGQYKKIKQKDDPEHYFTMLKQLTILGYFTSEIGASQTLQYIAVPGRYDGSYPYKKGDKAWATS
jgi:hypothetical protein